MPREKRLNKIRVHNIADDKKDNDGHQKRTLDQLFLFIFGSVIGAKELRSSLHVYFLSSTADASSSVDEARAGVGD